MSRRNFGSVSIAPRPAKKRESGHSGDDMHCICRKLCAYSFVPSTVGRAKSPAQISPKFGEFVAIAIALRTERQRQPEPARRLRRDEKSFGTINGLARTIRRFRIGSVCMTYILHTCTVRHDAPTWLAPPSSARKRATERLS